jgi:enoyl-CoA hydratase/carnithine racemase
MLFQCDLVYVAEYARLTVPFIDLGVVPENASSMTMVDRLGHTRAFALFGLGEPLMGKDAAAWGLANAALPAGEVEPRARAAALTLASKPPQSMRLTKQLMRDREALMARMRQEGEIFAERLRSPEAAAAFAAFLQKR